MVINCLIEKKYNKTKKKTQTNRYLILLHISELNGFDWIAYFPLSNPFDPSYNYHVCVFVECSGTRVLMMLYGCMQHTKYALCACACAYK